MRFRIAGDGQRGESSKRPAGSDQAREYGVVLAIEGVFRIRKCILAVTEAAAGKPALQPHDRIRPTHRQWFQRNCVVCSEKRRVHTDAQRKREHRYDRETRTLAQRAEPIPDILQECIDEHDAARLAALFFELFHAAKRQPGASNSFGAIESALQVFFNLLLEVKLQFLIQLTLRRPPANEGPKTMQKVAPHACASFTRSAEPRSDLLSPHATPESSWPESRRRLEESRRRRTSRDLKA